MIRTYCDLCGDQIIEARVFAQSPASGKLRAEIPTRFQDYQTGQRLDVCYDCIRRALNTVTVGNG